MYGWPAKAPPLKLPTTSPRLFTAFSRLRAPAAGAPAHFVVHSRPLDAQGRGIGEWTAHMSADVIGSPVDARATTDSALWYSKVPNVARACFDATK